MKKGIIGVLVMAVLMSLFAQPQANAASISGGVAAFNSWWSPSYKDMATGRNRSFTGTAVFNDSFHMNPAFLVGPSLSISLPAGFSVSTVFLYGSWFHSDAAYYTSLYKTSFSIDAKKYDLDVLVHYALHRYLKLFTGIKYQGYSFKGGVVQVDYSLTGVNVTPPQKAYMSGIGPGLGASTTIEIWGPLYLLANASVLYLSSNFRFDSFLMYRMVQHYQGVGFNGMVSLAWYIEPASVTISLGFRYQFLHYSLLQGSTRDYFVSLVNGITPMTKVLNDDRFYGITLSAIYTLDL
jgi:hypothetical protein